ERTKETPNKKQRSVADATGLCFFMESSFGTPLHRKNKKSSHRRTCADDGNTDREILPEIVCEAQRPSARFWVKFCRGGFQRGGTGPAGNCRAGPFPLLIQVTVPPGRCVRGPGFPPCPA